MKKQNIIIVLLLITAVIAVLGLKSKKQQLAQAQINTQDISSHTTLNIPKLLELGSVTCKPCKMMAPILEELKTTYAGKLNVEFIDTIMHRNATAKYNIRIIPTQIFFDENGKELFRHEGFFAKEDILAKWKKLGYNL